MTARLSAVLCIHNEEARLADCLEKLDFADELVVVLDRCTDGSRTIAEWFGARIVEGAFELEGSWRNAAIDAAAGDWIVEVDADEHFPPQLGDEIWQAIESPTGDWYVIPARQLRGQAADPLRLGFRRGHDARWRGCSARGASAGATSESIPTSRLPAKKAESSIPPMRIIWMPTSRI